MKKKHKQYAHAKKGEGLAVRNTIPVLVRIYQQAEADIRQGFALIKGAEDNLNQAFSEEGHESIRVQPKYSHSSLSFDRPEDSLEAIQRTIWRCLVDRLELRRFMSIKAWDDLVRQIDEGPVMDVTEENLTAMAEQFKNKLPEMLEAAVQEVFDWLRPRRNTYKTNSQFEVGKRVILSHIIDAGWNDNWDVDYHYRQHLTALENVFSALDGKGQVTKDHQSQLEQAIRKLPRSVTVGETPYFRFKCYINRNLHLEFRRLDLLDRFNKTAGGKRLREAAA